MIKYSCILGVSRCQGKFVQGNTINNHTDAVFSLKSMKQWACSISSGTALPPHSRGCLIAFHLTQVLNRRRYKLLCFSSVSKLFIAVNESCPYISAIPVQRSTGVIPTIRDLIIACRCKIIFLSLHSCIDFICIFSQYAFISIIKSSQ